MLNAIRPPAVPLVLCDPYFNVWSFSDNLYDDCSRHWTGERNAMTGLLNVDGVVFRFAGKADVIGNRPQLDERIAEQKSLRVYPLSTEYIFEESGVCLTVTFTSSILPDDLYMISRPLSYVRFSVRSIDSKEHDVKVYFDITGEWCVNTSDQEVACGEMVFKNAKSVFMGTITQDILNSVGDDRRIDWGYVHLIAPDGEVYQATISDRLNYIRNKKLDKKIVQKHAPNVSYDCPIAACELNFNKVSNTAKKNFIAIAYNDIKSIEYFGQQLSGYWQKDGVTFSIMVEDAVKNAEEIFQKSAGYDREIITDATFAGGVKYSELISLAFRQVYAAHKLIADKDGNAIFLSKENYSNGCIGTVDVSYPSIPAFLCYTPELVRGMMRPIFEFTNSEAWTFHFAPHDVGTYPKANGQVYGAENGKLLHKHQMPVEECGNMLIMAASVSFLDENNKFIEENFSTLEKWAEYLKTNGYDPENQLCTDDFAGHLAHNCNLSVKAIIGIAAFGVLCNLLNYSEKAASYIKYAKVLAVKWIESAKTEGRYRLAFDLEDSWSLKYNMVWDNILDLNIFPPEVKKCETDWYKKTQNRYGIPLDSRRDYTKTDWLVWAATLSNNEEDFEELIEPLWRFVSETPSRVPFTDWYDTKTGRQIGFQNRSVIGGIFIKLLTKKL